MNWWAFSVCIWVQGLKKIYIIDLQHPHYPRDPYSFSKHVAEQQADYISYVFGIRVASLRFHMTCQDWKQALDNRKHTDGADGEDAWDLWGWNTANEAARACLLGLTSEGWEGHEAFCEFSVADKKHSKRDLAHGLPLMIATTDIVAPDISTIHTVHSQELASRYWPKTSVRPSWWDAEHPHRGFYDCSKAEKLLGFKHHASS